MNVVLQNVNKTDENSFQEYEKRFKDILSLLKEDYSMGSPAALHAALAQCQEDGIFHLKNNTADFENCWGRVPFWVLEAVMEIVASHAQTLKIEVKGKNSKWIDKTAQDRVDYARYHMVSELFKRKDKAKAFRNEHGNKYGTFYTDEYERHKDIKWDNVFEIASERLKEKYEFLAKGGLIIKGYLCSPQTVERSYYKVHNNLKSQPHLYRDYAAISADLSTLT